MNTRFLHVAFALALTATLLGFAGVAHGVDGVVLIDQNRALAGNVTPGDAPGFPVTISQPGSYRLSGNLTVPDANTTAIIITASNVTIDLNGFAIMGPTVCTGTPVTSCAPSGGGIGITTAGSPSNITVRNGTVRGIGFAGILLEGNGNRVNEVHVESNGDQGIGIATSAHAVVSHNVATRNGGGIFVTGDATVSHNISKGNRFDGIAVARGIVNHNTAIENGRFGLSLGSKVGYTANVAADNAMQQITGGVSLGGGNHNLCNDVAC